MRASIPPLRFGVLLLGFALLATPLMAGADTGAEGNAEASAEANAEANAEASEEASAEAGAEAARERPRTASLGWIRLEGAEGCAGPGELARAIEARLGREAILSAARAELHVQGSIAAGDPGFVARVRLMDAQGRSLGERELRSMSGRCRDMDASLVLVVSLMVDPDATLIPGEALGPGGASGAPREPEPAVLAEPATGLMPPCPPITIPAPAARPICEPAPSLSPARPPPPAPIEPAPSWGFELDLSFALAPGVVPGAAPGASLRLALIPPGWLPIELRGLILADADAALPEGEGAVLSAALGGAGLCPLSKRSESWRADACTGLLAGLVQSHGFGFDRSLDEETLIAGAYLLGRAELRIVGGLGASLSGALLLPLLRASFYGDSAGGSRREVYAMPAVAGLLELGLALRF